MSEEINTDITLKKVTKALELLGYRLAIIPLGTSGVIRHLEKCCTECDAEATTPTPNPFIERDKQETAELAKIGLDDVPSWERRDIKKEAEKRIKDNNITNEDDKCKVYFDVKQQWLEYKEYKKATRVIA